MCCVVVLVGYGVGEDVVVLFVDGVGLECG